MEKKEDPKVVASEIEELKLEEHNSIGKQKTQNIPLDQEKVIENELLRQHEKEKLRLMNLKGFDDERAKGKKQEIKVDDEPVVDNQLLRRLDFHIGNCVGILDEDSQGMKLGDKYETIKEELETFHEEFNKPIQDLLKAIRDPISLISKQTEAYKEYIAFKIRQLYSDPFTRISEPKLLILEYHKCLADVIIMMYKDVLSHFIEADDFKILKDLVTYFEDKISDIKEKIQNHPDTIEKKRIEEEEKKKLEEIKKLENSKVKIIPAKNVVYHKKPSSMNEEEEDDGEKAGKKQIKGVPSQKSIKKEEEAKTAKAEEEDEEEEEQSTIKKNNMKARQKNKKNSDSESETEHKKKPRKGKNSNSSYEDLEEHKQETAVAKDAGNIKEEKNEAKEEEEEEEEETAMSTFKKQNKGFVQNEENRLADPMDVPHGTTTSKKMNFGSSEFNFYQKKRLFVTEILKDFKDIYEKNPFEFIKKVTVDQVVLLANKEDAIHLENMEIVKKYIAERSHNYGRLEKVTLLGKGGESQILRLNVFQPVEIVAKSPLPSSDGKPVDYKGIMMESHLVKMLENPEYIAKIHEEIIDYCPEQKLVLNYIVIVERAIYDLDKIVSIWQDEDKSKVNQEEFSQEKLAYFCLKAMEAVYYCHSNNVYFGDMKPQNLLVFRDLSVKLGDFGISMKLKPNPIKADFMKQTAQLKGYTRGFTLPVIETEFANDTETEFSYDKLILNDYYSLRMTFEEIKKKFPDKIKTDSLFYQMVRDLTELNIQNKDLQQVLYKWRSIISNDKAFIEKLCDQIIREEKLIAIPNILKLSKYRKMFLEIQNTFAEEENKTFLYKKENDYNTLEQEGQVIASKDEPYDPFYPIYTQDTHTFRSKKQSKTSDKTFIEEMIDDIEPYLKRLFIYIGTLEQSYYKNYYYEVFNACFSHNTSSVLPIQNPDDRLSSDQKLSRPLSRETFNECSKYLLRKIFIVDKKQLENEGMSKENIQKKQESNLKAFKRLVDFIVSTSARTDSDYERMLITMIKLSVEFKLPELEFDLIYCYNKTNFDENNKRILKNKFNFAFKSKQMSKAKEEFDKAIQCYLFAIKCQKAVQGYIWKHEIRFEMERIRTIPNFDQYKKKSFYSIYYGIKAGAKDYETNDEEDAKKKIKLLEKERTLYSKIYGEQGDQMLENGFQLYSAYKAIKNQDKQEYYLRKIIDYSNKLKKVELLSFLFQDYKSGFFQYHNNVKEGIDSLQTKSQIENIYRHLKSANPILFYLCYKYFHQGIPTQNELWKDDEYQNQLERMVTTQGYDQIFPFINNKKYIYQEVFQAHIGKSFCSISTEIQDQYQAYSDSIYERLLSNAMVENIIESDKLAGAELKIMIDQLEKHAKGFDRSNFPMQFKIKKIGIFFGSKYPGNKLDGLGLIRFNDGTIYYGNFQNSLLSGQGQYFFPPGSAVIKYIGEFKDNVYNGDGILHFSNNDKYIGEFRNGMFNGQGKLIQKTSTYDGQWVNNKRNGLGSTTEELNSQTQQVQSYFGLHIDNEKSGKGKLVKKEGENTLESYDGNWLNNQREGKGVEVYLNKASYTGEFSKNKRHGKGDLTLTNGTIYSGLWVEGEYQGDGKTQHWVVEDGSSFVEVEKVEKNYPNGDHYEGFLFEDQFYGKGLLKNSKGYIYKGWFRNGRKNGEGELTLPNGDVFTGQFKNNMKQGVGIYTVSSKDVIKVEYQDDKQLVYSGSDDYEGTTYLEKKQGFGIYEDKKKGTKYEGCFVNDLMEGEGTLIDEKGTYVGNFFKGLRHGNGYQTLKTGGFYDGEYRKDYYHGEGMLCLPEQSISSNQNNAQASSSINKMDNFSQENKNQEVEDLSKNSASVYLTTYFGRFRNGIKQGFGIFKCKSYIYKGEFDKDKMSGLGIKDQSLDGKGGDEYQGMFRNDLRNGHGILYKRKPDSTEKNDAVEKFYEGNFIDDKRSGLGEEPGKYKGEYLNDERNGIGEETFEQDGEKMTYNGKFMNGSRSGQGVINGINKYMYKGEFKENQKSGNGVEWQASGGVYEGRFQNDKRDGYGIFKYSDKGSDMRLRKQELPLLNLFNDYMSIVEEVFQLKKDLYGKIKLKFDEVYLLDSELNEIERRDGNLEKYQPKNNIYSTEFPLKLGILFKTIDSDITESKIQFVLASIDMKVSGNITSDQFYTDYQLILSQDFKWQDKVGIQKAQMQIKLDKVNESMNLVEYQGMFSKGKREGDNGTLISKLYTFKGKFKDHYKDSGVLELQGGDVYDGQFREVYQHGSGKLTTAEGEVFTSNFYFNFRASQVKKYIDKFGNSYSGGLLPDNTKDGYGEFKTFKYTFNGFFSNGLLESGEFIDQKYIYNGQFKNNQKHYNGVETFKNSGVTYTYDGQFYKDFKLGEGKLRRERQIPVEVRFDFSLVELKVFYEEIESKDKYCIEDGTDYSEYFKRDQTIVDENGSEYTGDLLNNMKFGYGCLKLKNKDVYVGAFWRDEMHGTGRYGFASGTSYHGEFEHDKITGQGLMIYPNGDTYTGQFLDGKREGSGVYRTKSGEEFAGKFQNDMISEGTFQEDDEAFPIEGSFDFQTFMFTFADTKTQIPIQKMQIEDREQRLVVRKFVTEEGDYEGQMLGELKHGDGRMIYKNGEIFEGKFENDRRISGIYKLIFMPVKEIKLNMEGNIDYEDKELFKINNHEHPVEPKTKKDRSKIGNEEDSFACDKCTHIVPASSISYSCISCNHHICPSCINSHREQDVIEIIKIEGDQISGDVKIKFANNNVYTGKYFKGKMQGKGTMKFANDDEYTGQFFNNLVHGQGRMDYFARGDKYEGEFMFGKRQGMGVYTFKNGDKFNGCSYLNTFIEGKYSQTKVKDKIVEKLDYFQIMVQEADSNKQLKKEKIQLEKELELEQEKAAGKTVPENINDFKLASNGKVIHLGVLESYIQDGETEEEFIERVTLLQTQEIIHYSELSSPATYSDGQLIEIFSYYPHRIHFNSNARMEKLAIEGHFDYFIMKNSNLGMKTTKTFKREVLVSFLGEIQRKIAINDNFATETKEYVVTFGKDLSDPWYLYEIFEFKDHPNFSLSAKLPIKEEEPLPEKDAEPKNEVIQDIESQLLEINQEMAKTLFVFLQVLVSSISLHKKKIVYNSFSENTILIMNNYSVKLSDFSKAQLLNSKDKDEYKPMKIEKEFANGCVRKALKKDSYLKQRELFENDYYQILKLLLKSLNTKSEIYEKSEYFQYLKNLIVTTNSDYYESSVEKLERRLYEDKKFQELLLGKAVKDENIEAQNYISFVIFQKFKLDCSSYSQFISPFNQVYLILGAHSIFSFANAFKNVALNLVDEHLKEDKEAALVKQLIENFKTKDRNLGQISERGLQLKNDRGILTNEIDWDYFEKQILDKDILSAIEEEAKKIDAQTENVKEKLKIDLPLLHTILKQSAERFKNSYLILSKANFSDKFRQLTSKFTYQKLIKHESYKSECDLIKEFEKVNSILKKTIAFALPFFDSKQNLSIIDRNQYQLKLFLGSLIQVPENQLNLVQNKYVDQIFESTYKILYKYDYFQDYQKSTLIRKMIREVEQPLSRPERNDNDLLTFIGCLIFICEPQKDGKNHMISECYSHFKNKQYKMAQDVFDHLIDPLNFSLYMPDSEDELLPSQKQQPKFQEQISELMKLLKKIEPLISKQMEGLSILRNVFLQYEIAIYLDEPNKFKNTITNLLNVDYDGDNDSASSQTKGIGGVTLQKKIRQGILLDQTKRRNDFENCLAKYFKEKKAELEFKILRIAKIKYIEIAHKIKALKVYYEITENNELDPIQLSTSWYGLPLGQDKVKAPLKSFKESILFKKGEDITNVKIQRNPHLGLRIVTSQGNVYSIGNCENMKDYSELSEEKLGRRVLWFECAFRPTDSDYPEESDQIMYHFSYYWTEVKKK